MVKDLVKDTLQKNFPRFLHHLRYFRSIGLRQIEPEIFYLDRLVNGQMVAVDVGASLGIYSEYLSRRVKKVIAIEPIPYLASHLRQVLPKHCEVYAVALSDQTMEEATLRVPKNGHGQSIHYQATLDEANTLSGPGIESIDAIKVPLRTLDSVLVNESRVDFIKIDAEGHEAKILHGAQTVLKKFHPVLFIEIENRHNPISFDECLGLLSANGYHGHFFLNGYLQPISMFNNAVHQDISLLGTRKYVNNFLFTPQPLPTTTLSRSKTQ